MTTTTRRTRPAKKTGDPQADRTARLDAERALAAEQTGSTPLAASNGHVPADDGVFYSTYFLSKAKSEFVVHLVTCEAGRSAARRNSQYEGKAVPFQIVSRADAVRQLWDDQMAESEEGTEHWATDANVLGSAYDGECFFHSCLKALPDSVQPVTEQPAPPADAKTVKRDAKQALARYLADAVARAIEDLGSSASLSELNKLISAGLPAEDQAKAASHWMHHWPTGEQDGQRYFPATLPRPDRSDWR